MPPFPAAPPDNETVETVTKEPATNVEALPAAPTTPAVPAAPFVPALPGCPAFPEFAPVPAFPLAP